MQTVAQSWLVLELTGSGTAIGVVVALQTLPILLLGPYGGVIADRTDKRRLMIGLQSIMGVQALLLGILTITGTVQLWHVYVLALLLGLNQCFENPARQSFLLEMVGPEICATRSASIRPSSACPASSGPRWPCDHRGGRPGRVLPDQRRQLRRGGQFAVAVGYFGAASVRSGERARGQLREGCAMCAVTGPRGAAADDGVHRLPRVRVPVCSRSSPTRPSCGFAGLRFHDGRDGHRLGVRRSARRDLGRTGTRVLIVAAAAFGFALVAAAAAPTLALVTGRAGARRCGEHRVQLDHQQHAPTRGRPADAGPVMALWSTRSWGRPRSGVRSPVGSASSGVGAPVCCSARSPASSWRWSRGS